MINYFKRIRQKLLKNGNVKRYLAYAIGEILLVMIGILLALQINSWNENRNKVKRETSILKELEQNLQDQVIEMTINLETHQNGQRSTEFILMAFRENLPLHDSLKVHFGNIHVMPRFVQTNTAYENLKSSGIQLIQNDSLRVAILELFERRFQLLTEYFDSQWNETFKDYRGIYRNKFASFDLYGPIDPINYDALKIDQEYLNYLNHRIGWVKVDIRAYARTIEMANDLGSQIENELASR